MRYCIELTIDVPREQVVALFCDPEHLKDWQPELVSYEPLSGETGKPGSKVRLVSKIGKRNVEMIETVLKRDLPEECSGTYETKGVWNRVDNRFVVVDQQKTRWEFVSEFKCTGFLKFLSLIAPSVFKAQSRRYMQQFKVFAEENRSHRLKSE